jgi:hypothetical protein
VSTRKVTGMPLTSASITKWPCGPASTTYRQASLDAVARAALVVILAAGAPFGRSSPPLPWKMAKPIPTTTTSAK